MKIQKRLSNTVKKNDIEVVGKLPYDNVVTEAMIHEKSVIEFSDGDMTSSIIDMWHKIRERLPA
jgi:MinD superfamily P-loop ATPase